MCTLIIIQCSGTKVKGGIPLVANDPFSLHLDEVRNEIIRNKNIDMNYGLLMPAYKRYGAMQRGNAGGRLYTNINWQLALDLVEAGKLKILIVSALFGLLEYNTHIPYYDLTMDKAKRYWLRNGILKSTVLSYLQENPDITNVKSFLSRHYHESLAIADIENSWVSYDRGTNTAKHKINPLLEVL